MFIQILKLVRLSRLLRSTFVFKKHRDGDLVQDFVVLESTIEGEKNFDYILLETGNYERILNESSSQDVGGEQLRHDTQLHLLQQRRKF